MKRAAAPALLIAILAVAALCGAAEPVMQKALGDWRSPTGSIVRVEPCGSNVCLRIVQLPPNPTMTRDKNNPAENLRTRPLCGLVIGTGFYQNDATHLSGGRLYDPQSGRTYSGTIQATGDRLQLRGYIGISLFGRSETWQRIAGVSTCSTH